MINMYLMLMMKKYGEQFYLRYNVTKRNITFGQ